MTIVLQDYIKRNAYLQEKPVNITLEYRLARMKVETAIQANVDFFRPVFILKCVLVSICVSQISFYEFL